MKLPADAYIDPRKITDYLLRMLEDSGKSAFLARAGYGEENPEVLISDIAPRPFPRGAYFWPLSDGQKSFRSYPCQSVSIRG